jgi:outer membrane receptor for ferrienterochelin and colicins
MRSGAAWRSISVAFVVTLLGGSALTRSALAQGERTLRGRVSDAETGKGVIGAEILIDGGTGGRARSGADGEWRLRTGQSPPYRIRVRHPGYAYRELQVGAGDAAALVVTTLRPLAIPLDAVIVTAARREQRLGDAVVETELISDRELRQSGASDVAAVLTERSGMQLDGGVPSGAGVQMRGFDARRVLVLVDGEPVTGRINGNFDLSRLPTSMISRIEIVKGPQSTLYGSDALGGVVNIITRRATEPGWDVGLSSVAGTQGRRELSGNGAWRRGASGGTLDAGLRRLDLAPGVAGDDGTFARRWNGAASWRWQPDSARLVDISALGIGEAQRYRTGQLFHFADNTQWGARASAQMALGNGRLTGAMHLSTFDHLSRASTGARPASDSGAQDAQRLAQADLLYNGSVGRALVDVGLQGRRETIRADRVVTADPSVATLEPFLQATLPIGTLTVTPGMRLSWSDRWGRFVAPRLAAMWRPREAVAVRASLGRGFRAPDFKALYLDFVNSAAGYAVRGNPDLRPEESTSASLGTEWTGERFWARAAAFRNEYRDFIETREPDAQGTYTYANVARGRTEGVELEGGVALDVWRLDASYDYLRARDLDAGVPLLGRPAHSARGSATGPIAAGVRGTLSVLFTGRTPIDRSTSGAIPKERASWTRVDARLSRSLSLGAEWSIGVTNVFDRRLSESWPGFTGRQLFAGITWTARGS